METKQGILHVKVNLIAKSNHRNSSVADKPNEFTPNSNKSHKGTLSLSIPSESSPRLIKLKKSLKPSKNCSKPNLIKFSLNSKNRTKLIQKSENKENLKKNSKEFSAKPEESPSLLMKSSRNSTLTSIPHLSHRPNLQKNSEEFTKKLEEIPSNLLKSNRKSILSSILQTSHKHLVLKSSKKY